MWETIVGGGIASFLFSRLLTPNPPGAQMQRPAALLGPGRAAPLPLDAHLDPRIRAGLDRLLMVGNAAELHQGAIELLQAGYPHAANACMQRANALRQADAQRQAADAHQARVLQERVRQQAEIQTLAEARRQMQAVQQAQTAATQTGTPPIPVANPVQAPPAGSTVIASPPSGPIPAPPGPASPAEGALSPNGVTTAHVESATVPTSPQAVVS